MDSTTPVRRRPSARRPSPTLQYGDIFDDRYMINGFAGKGATSYVYRARSVDSFETVAIKVLHSHLLQDAVKRRRFMREARVMMGLRHRNIVRFAQIIERPDCLAFIMEYIDGQTLSEWLNAQAHELDEVDLACVFVDILRGLASAHAAGIVHRDLKPANVLITMGEQGRYVAKIIDFGVAKVLGEEVGEGEQGKIVGTAAYISPEEINDPVAVCPASDLYSLGVMLYEAMCGERPFHGMPVYDLMDAHAYESPRPPRAINPAISPAFESVILRTLHKMPNGRFESAPDMIRAMEMALQGMEIEADPLTSSVEALATPSPLEAQGEASPEPDARARSLMSLIGQCARGALSLFGATGVTGRAHDPHHLARVSIAPQVPLG